MSLGRVASISRHQLRLVRSNPEPIVVLLLVPLGNVAVLTPLVRLSLLGDGLVGVSGAEVTVPGVTITFASVLSAFVALALLHEQLWGTWERLTVSSASLPEIVVGQAAPYVAIGLAQYLVLFIIGRAVFGMRGTGAVAAVVVLACAVTLFAVSLGVLVASVARTVDQASAFGFGSAVVLGTISGGIVPLELYPAWVEAIAPFNPLWWAVRAFRSVVIDGDGVAATLPAVGVLTAGAVGAAGLAALLHGRRREDGWVRR